MFHNWDDNLYETPAVRPTIATVTTEIGGAGVDMAKYNNYAALVVLGSATQYVGALTCYIAESTDNSTWSNTMLATLTIASSTTTEQVGLLEINATDLSDGYRYARVEINPAAGTVTPLSAVNVQFNKRFS